MEAHIAGISFNNVVDGFEGKSILLFFSGSNFKLPYSFNGVLHEARIEYKILLKDVKQLLKDNCWHDYVIFTGGEALLQRRACLDLMAYVKGLGMKVALETNGTKPDALEGALEQGLVDRLLFFLVPLQSPDVFEKVTKSNTFFYPASSLIADIKKSLELVKKKEVDVFFHTTVVPSLLYRKEHFMEIADTIKDIPASWVLQRFTTTFNKPYDSRFCSVEEPSEHFVETLRSEILKEYPQMQIEIGQNLCFPYHEEFTLAGRAQ